MGRIGEDISVLHSSKPEKRRPDVIQAYFNLYESAIYNAQISSLFVMVVVILHIKIGFTLKFRNRNEST